MTTNNVLRTLHTIYSFQSAAYSPTGVSDLSSGTPTVVDLSMDLAAEDGLDAGQARNSDQLDLGTTWAEEYFFMACIEWFGAVTAGGTVDFYWSGSGNSNVANGNPGDPDGVDGLYAPANWTVAEGVLQMTRIGAHINNGYAGIQIANVGILRPKLQYGQLIMVNNTSATLAATDDIECSVLMYPNIPDIQAAA